MSLFKKKSSAKSYDKDTQKPVIKASICNGEQVAGFKDLHTGKFEEVMLICSAADLDAFRAMYTELRKEGTTIERNIRKTARKSPFHEHVHDSGRQRKCAGAG